MKDFLSTGALHVLHLNFTAGGCHSCVVFVSKFCKKGIQQLWNVFELTWYRMNCIPSQCAPVEWCC